MENSFFLNLIKGHWLDLVIIVVVLGIAIFMYVKGYNKKFLNHLILSLVVEAEQKLGSGTGEYKFSEVVANLYVRLPMIVRLFISEKYIEDLIETNVKELKKFLEEGGNISDYQIKFLENNNLVLLTAKKEECEKINNDEIKVTPV